MSKLFWVSLAIVVGCKETPAAVDAAPAVSAEPSAAPSASVAAAPSASAAPEEHHDCPAGSTGIGSFSHPCEAKGSARMVTIAWNGKSDDKGSPWFNTTSKSSKTLLYGRLAVYFYDKAGKLIDAKEPVEGSDKTHPYHTCAGNVFQGGLNPSEKAKYTFSCVKKSDVPDGAKAIEAEATIVGFADAAIKKNDFYWKNADLAPDTRPKGGIK